MGTDRANLITQSLQVDVFVDPLATIVGQMTAHSYIPKVQSTYLMNQKQSLDSDLCIIMLDCAENDRYVLQGDISHFITTTANAAFTQPMLL